MASSIKPKIYKQEQKRLTTKARRVEKVRSKPFKVINKFNLYTFIVLGLYFIFAVLAFLRALCAAELLRGYFWFLRSKAVNLEGTEGEEGKVKTFMSN